MEIFQQGDVIFKKIDSIPNGLEKIDSEVIQEGEATGHAHRLFETEYEFYSEPKTKKRFLRIIEGGAVRHEEHKEITLPPGEYEVGIVREYDHWMEESRAVVD